MSTRLLPELFPLILYHIPVSSRIPTSLSVSLTCRLLYNVIIPNVLYHDVRLIEDDRAHCLLERLIDLADPSEDNSQGGGNFTLIPYQCIRHFSIEISKLEAPLTGILQRLLDSEKLTNLVSFALRFLAEAILPATLWQSIKEHCPNLKEVALHGVVQPDGWFQSEVFTNKGTNRFVDLSNIPSKLHTLKLSIWATGGGAMDADCPGGLLSCNLPDLRTLIINPFRIRQPALTTEFWKRHSNLERLELCDAFGDWFQDFESGMLPNLKDLKIETEYARRLLPFVAKSLVSLYLLDTCNAQA
ncbi:hypothetical protein H0H92_011175, partial [Tricholoma furcatifolium]